MTKTLFMEDVRPYLLSKPCVKSIGIVEMLQFAPLHEAVSPTKIEGATRPAYEALKRDANETALKQFAEVFNPNQGIVNLFLDFPLREQPEFSNRKNETMLSSALIEGIDEITAQDFLAKNGNINYSELQMKKKLAQGIAGSYGLELLMCGSGLLLAVNNPLRLEKLDALLEATAKYVRQSCNSGFQEKILKTAEIIERLID